MSLPFEEIRAGNLGVRIANREAEIVASQRLRYKVFVEEMGAQPDEDARATGIDSDQFDAVADHLLVLDHNKGEDEAAVVGSYRLIRRAAASKVGRFYSADEYDISCMENFPGEVLELGRSCVAVEYRNRGSMQLLWEGIAAYVSHYRIEVMFGCASLPGIDLQANAAQLSYLYHKHLAPEAIRPVALPSRYESMNLLPPEAYDAKRALLDLPPLIKGYLRLGGFVGDGAVLDVPFNTTDVSIVVKTDLITSKYSKHYERKLGAEDVSFKSGG
jgi:putative hemolysin